jgi:hypothetical protein
MTNYGHSISNTSAIHLAHGDKMMSENKKLTLEFLHDGNLVLTHVAAGIIWAANCHGRGGNSFNIQRDGNAVVCNGNNDPIWTTGTFIHNRSLWGLNRLVLQDDSNLVMYHKERPVWSSKPRNFSLNYGCSISNTSPVHLSPGDKMGSENGKLTLEFQLDGNLVLNHVDDGIIWNASCHGQGGSSFNIQEDGNAVVINKNGMSIWETGTSYGNYYSLWNRNKLVLHDDGNLVMYHNEKPVWSSRKGIMGERESDVNLNPMKRKVVRRAEASYASLLSISQIPNASRINPMTLSGRESKLNLSYLFEYDFLLHITFQSTF